MLNIYTTMSADRALIIDEMLVAVFLSLANLPVLFREQTHRRFWLLAAFGMAHAIFSTSDLIHVLPSPII